MFLILLYPIHPVTLVGWIVWIGLSIPLLGVEEYLGEKIFSERISKRIDNRPTIMSAKRIFYGVVVSVFAAGLILLVAEIVKSSFGEFLNQNFPKEW